MSATTNVRTPEIRAAIDTQARTPIEAVEPARSGAGRTPIIASFLAVVFALTGLAINSHRQAPGEAAIEAPPGAPGTATAPAETTGAAPARMPLPAPPAQ